MTTGLLSPADFNWVVSQASRAPSVHNTQPWRFRWTGDAIEVYADTGRNLPLGDPDGRELVISCGAAIFNLRLALRHLRRTASVMVLPDQQNPRLLARVAVRAGPPATTNEERLREAILRRHTHRSEFDWSPIRAAHMVGLQQAADANGASLLLVSEPGRMRAVLQLSHAAERAAAMDERLVAETTQWTPAPGSPRRDGVPTTSYGPRGDDDDDLASRNFDLGRSWGSADSGSAPAGPLAALVTDRDVQDDWLTAGQAMQAVLLTAASDWAFASLHSRVCELPHLRTELRRQLGTSAYPHLLMTFGYATIAPVTPRRSLDEIAEFAS